MEEFDDHVIIAKNDFQGLVKIFKLASGYKKSLFSALGILVAASGLAMLSANILGRLGEYLGKLSRAEMEIAAVLPLAGVFLAIEGIIIFMRWFGGLSLARATNQMILGLRLNMFKKLSLLPISYFDKQPLGRIITRLTGDVEGIEQLFAASLSRIIDALIKIVAVLLAMIITSPKFGLIVVAFSLPAATLNLFTKKIILYWMREQKKRVARVNAKLAEFLGGLGVIKILGLENWTRQEFHNRAIDYWHSQRILMNINTIVMPTTVFLCAVPVIAVLYIGGGKVLDGSLSVAVFITFLRYTEYFLNPVRTISSEIQQIQNALSSTERVRNTLEENEEQSELGLDGTLNLKIRGKIEFKNVSMSYPLGEPVLKDISFCIHPSQKVGLVGTTGSGKTTTVSLISRLYEFQSGKILIDDVDIRSYNRKSLRQQLGYVTQDAIIFQGTIRENLLAAVEYPVSDYELLLACSQTGLSKVLAHHPEGLDKVLLDGGSNLSAGERQLVNFTRMLIRKPAIMILDEATAHTDDQTEVLLHEALHKTMSGRTCFIIAHRLSTIKECDLLLVFDRGCLVEVGSPSELTAHSEYYLSLASRQMTLSPS
jgi:ABC-type multidrug transport system fused ATPase/permease subunit